MSRLAALAAGALVLGLVAAAGWSAWVSGSAVAARPGGAPAGPGGRLFLGLLVAAFIAYLVGLWLLGRLVVGTTAVTVLALAIQLVPVTAPLLLSTDAWAYWGYGWIGSTGGANPYRDPPSDVPGNPAVGYMGSAWLETTTVYGPAFTAASEPVAVLAGDSPDRAAWSYKILAGVAVAAAAILAGRVSRRRALAVAFVGWNPILAVHLAGGGHNDAWVGAMVVAALALAAARRLDGAGAMWALAIFVKWVPAVFLVLRAVEARGARRQVSHRGFAAAAAVLVTLAGALYGVAWIGALSTLLDTTSLETSYAIPARLEQAGLPHAVVIAVAGAVLATGLAWLLLRAHRGRAPLGLAACLLLVTTPYLAVWYLGWAVPTVAADDDRLAAVVCLALCAYLLPQTIPV